jgi:hypothetical protein
MNEAWDMIGMFLYTYFHLTKSLDYEYRNEDNVWHPTLVCSSQVLSVTDALVSFFIVIVSYFLMMLSRHVRLVLNLGIYDDSSSSSCRLIVV